MKKTKRMRQNAANKMVFTPEREAQHRLQAGQYLNEGKHLKAKEEIDNIRKCNPKADIQHELKQLLLVRGKWNIERNNYQNALADLKQAHQQFSESDESFSLIAKCYVKLNQEKEAKDLIQQNFDQESLPQKDAGLLLKLLLIEEQLDEVQRLLTQKAHRFAQEEVEWAKGVLALKKGNAAEASAYFEQAHLKLEHDAEKQAFLKAWQAYSFIEEGQQEKAQSLIQALTDSTVKGWLWLHAHNRTSAPDALRHAQNYLPQLNKRSPVQERFLKELENALAKKSHHDAAHFIEEHTREFSKLPFRVALERSIYRLAAQEAFEHKEYDCAKIFFDKSLQLHPNDWLHHKNVVVQGWSAGFEAFPQWVKTAERLLQIELTKDQNYWSPQQANFTLGELYGYLALHYYNSGHLLRARTEAKKAHDKAPESPVVQLLEGFEAFAVNDLKKAGIDYEKALESGFPISDKIYENLRKIYSQSNQSEKLYQWRKIQGKSRNDLPVSAFEIETKLYFAQSKGKLHHLEKVLKELKEERHLLIDAVQLFLDSSDKSQWNSKNKMDCTLSLGALQEKLEPLKNEKDRIELLKYYLIAFDFYKKTPTHKRLLTYLRKELESRIATNPNALLALVQCLGTQNKVPKDFKDLLKTLLNTTDHQIDTLVALQRFWLIWGYNDRCLKEILELLQKEPEHPSLLWAASTLPLTFNKKEAYHQKGFEITKKLQDEKLFELFNLKEKLAQLNDAYSYGPQSGLGGLFGGGLNRMFGNPFGQGRSKFGGVNADIFGELARSLFEEDDEDFDDEDFDEEEFDMDFEDFMGALMEDPELLKSTSFQMELLSTILEDPERAKFLAKKMGMPPDLLRMLEQMAHKK
ncbi:tetratricopeptide repeat protein [Deltaproteobacteria bacterium TL4]